jgi:hypothetical protein
MTAEHERLREANTNAAPWRRWGPYLSERQWGTPRENQGLDADTWGAFPHDQARSRVYRWGEDGIAGISDDRQLLCFALAFWNGRDRILKERLFGLANGEGNHGEDVKECYFYLDNLPTHAYMRMLYKYPQAAFPYAGLVHQNRERSRLEAEYELTDTGAFDGDRYFDIFIEYAKESAEEILVLVTAANRGPEAACLEVLPHLWFRNTWWQGPGAPRPSLGRLRRSDARAAIAARHPDIGTMYLQCESAEELLFTDNESNTERLYGLPNATPFVKDGIDEYIVNGDTDAVDPLERGTKAAARHRLEIGPSESRTVRLRLGRREPSDSVVFGSQFDATMGRRRREADEFYEALAPPTVGRDDRSILRQALAGLMWSKQAYLYDAAAWLNDHRAAAPRRFDRPIRNRELFHLAASDVISVPDKWEYPGFESWDIAFQTIAWTFVDPDFAAGQLEVLLREHYMQPDGRIPASEWSFGDVDPPVHAWATLFMYRLMRLREPQRASYMLRRAFNSLLLNFTWWANRRDRTGRNVFEGGFVGVDHAGLLDHGAAVPTGGYLEEADASAWMALYSQNMLEMALELATQDPAYEELATKFYEHFIWIAAAMDRVGDLSDEMWDEKDGFFYDVMRFPNGAGVRLKVRSLVGLLPLCAVTVFPADLSRRLPRFAERMEWFNRERADLLRNINNPATSGLEGRRMLSLLNEHKLRRLLARLLDPEEFLSEHGIRSLSRHYREHPYVFKVGRDEYEIAYRAGESSSGLFGGNASWRGPVWFPVNILLIRAFLQLYSYYGKGFTVECPTGSGQTMTLFQVATFLGRRLISLFERDAAGRRPAHGGERRFQSDPHWRDLILFHEYFDGDDGAGLGASHRTGWTALVVAAIHLCAELQPEDARRDLGIVFQRLAARSAATLPGADGS